jgi:hypothetical protein
VVAICNLRCEAASTPDKLQSFISRAILLDQQFDLWLTTLPETWNYAVYTAPPGHGHDAAYDSRYHIYYDLWTGSMWNTYRSARIMLNLVLVGWLKASSESTADLATYPSECAHAIQIMYQLSRDICESVSFHLKSYPGCVDTPRAIGGYFVLWPLFAASNPPGVDSALRVWVIERLDFIAHCMGIQQASSIACRLRTK